jgi:hypothetical protein
MNESVGKSQKLAITNHPVMYNKNKTWHASWYMWKWHGYRYEQWSPLA